MGVARGAPGVPVKTTYNIPWQKRHDDNVWHSVTTPLKNPGYAPACWLILARHFKNDSENLTENYFGNVYLVEGKYTNHLDTQA